MSRYSQGFRTTGTSNAVLEIIGGAGSRAHLVELGMTIVNATATQVGLGFSSAVGLTPVAPVTFLSDDDNSTLAITTALAWATPPTLPTYFYRRATLPVVQGFPLVWKWHTPLGLLLLPATSIVLWLFATGSVIDGWAVFEQ